MFASSQDWYVCAEHSMDKGALPNLRPLLLNNDNPQIAHMPVCSHTTVRAIYL